MNVEADVAPMAEAGQEHYIDRIMHRYLTTAETLTEAIFGLLMAMTITNTLWYVLDVSESQLAATAFVAALGCNIAWGLADGTLMVLRDYYDRARFARMLERGKGDLSEDDLHSELEDSVIGVLDAEGQKDIEDALLRYAAKKGQLEYRLRARDLLDVLVCVALNVLMVFPIVLPFALLPTAKDAILASNAIGITILFCIGFAWAKDSFRNRLTAGAVMALIGMALATILVLLGG
jgi:hypothetical protein